MEIGADLNSRYLLFQQQLQKLRDYQSDFRWNHQTFPNTCYSIFASAPKPNVGINNIFKIEIDLNLRESIVKALKRERDG